MVVSFILGCLVGAAVASTALVVLLGAYLLRERQGAINR